MPGDSHPRSPGDSHPRSAHRASPVGGLALLTPQALVRQAQAGQARARQAIIRQAVARQSAKLQPAHLYTGHLHTARPHSAPLHSAPLRSAEPLAGQWAAVPGRQRHAHQRRARRRAPREPQQALQSLMRGLGALIVLAIVGLSGFFVVAEERRGQGGESAAPPGAEPGIASREVDAEPLTQVEVFPEPSVRLTPNAPAYQVTMTHSDSECRIATTGELGALLEGHGCDQVVRARLTAPYGGYQVTTGVFNLADEAGAAQVSELTGGLVEAGRGSFATLGGSAGDPLAEPLAQVGWHSRGHFLLYCVVARPDGQLVTDDDTHAARITAELVEEYLGERVIGQRTLDP